MPGPTSIRLSCGRSCWRRLGSSTTWLLRYRAASRCSTLLGNDTDLARLREALRAALLAGRPAAPGGPCRSGDRAPPPPGNGQAATRDTGQAKRAIDPLYAGAGRGKRGAAGGSRGLGEDEDLYCVALRQPGFLFRYHDQRVGPAERGDLMRALPGQRRHDPVAEHAAQVGPPALRESAPAPPAWPAPWAAAGRSRPAARRARA